MGLFSRKIPPAMPARRGPDIAIPDPYTHAPAMVPNATAEVPVTPGTYAEHVHAQGLDAGTAVQPQSYAYQTALRKPTYWHGFGRDVPNGPNWDLMDEYRRLYATRPPEPQSEHVPAGWNTDYLAQPAHPGTAHNPDPQRPQFSQSTWREVARYDQNWGRRLTGIHFSMASNIRAYPIGGLSPFQRYRNTFRLEPPPVDLRMTDLPSETIQTVSSQDVTSKRSPFRKLV
jgi:hypothetical protein